MSFCINPKLFLQKGNLKVIYCDGVHDSNYRICICDMLNKNLPL